MPQPLALLVLLGDAQSAITVPLALLVVFVSAKLMAEVAERLGQPGITGEILAGVVIGPGVLNWIAPSQLLSALAELGAMFLLFRVGLEVKAKDMVKVGGTATVVAAAGVIVPFLMGTAILLGWGSGTSEALFVGAAMAATSVGITAQVLAARGLLQQNSARIILAAAVIDDVLGLLVLAVVSSVARGRFDWLQIGLTTVAAAGFTVVVALWGPRTINKLAPHVERNSSAAESRFVLALALLFSLAVLAVYAGVAAIVGAFLAGMAFSDSAGQRERDLAQGVSELLVPFFLVGVGLQVDLAAFAHWPTALLGVTILLAAAASKFIGCGLGAWALGRKEALRVGVGMIPRGEVGMVVAQIGLGYGILSHASYGVVVFMSVASTMIAPPLLKLAYVGVAPGADAAVAASEAIHVG
jgi:Kef-type K+ transport system membrane component KefB